MKRTNWLFFACASLAVVGLLASAWVLRGATAELTQRPDVASVAYIGAERCENCHQDRHESWARTYHRTMTQAVSEQTVQGKFEGQSLSYFGATLRPIKEGQRYYFEFLDASAQPIGKVEINRLVGSHRYQQFLTKHVGSAEDPASETYYRLHYLWHQKEQRWVHMNAAFLGRDTQLFDEQVANWNSNCVFCHNTGPKPRISNLDALRERARAGERVDVQQQARYDTELADLGISCEACHGPGGEHANRMARTPLRLAASMGTTDQSIVNPEDLDAARSNDVCGACHAQRTVNNANDIDRLLREGPSFRPGNKLSDHVQVLQASTTVPGNADPHLYQNRFWSDGSVRLSAYEFQALNASACAKNAELSCIGCHTMHGGEPEGQLPAGVKDGTPGDRLCLRCHEPIKQQLAEHTRHSADSDAARCISCHMPRQVYGVMDIHRSHQIQTPNPTLDANAGKPNACLNCHLEQNSVWAQTQLNALWPKTPKTMPAQRADGAPLELADGFAALIAGDPVRQAVAAFELGNFSDATLVENLRLRLPWLIAALADDRPGIRRFAWHSLQKLDARLALGLTQSYPFDYQLSAEASAPQRDAITVAFAALDKTTWAPPRPNSGLLANYQIETELLATLHHLGAQQANAIDIGE